MWNFILVIISIFGLLIREIPCLGPGLDHEQRRTTSIDISNSSRARERPYFLEDEDRVKIYLGDYPFNALKLSMRDADYFPCAVLPGTTCTVELIPPIEADGLLIVVQNLKLRTNPKNAASAMEEADTNVCRDYLQVKSRNTETAPSQFLCGDFRFQMNLNGSLSINKAQLVGSFFQIVTNSTESIELTLRHDASQIQDNIKGTKWKLDRDFGGEIMVTSFTVGRCKSRSNVSLGPSRSCPGNSYCIPKELFCDRNINCPYKSGSGTDESGCPANPKSQSDSLLHLLRSKLSPITDRITTTPSNPSDSAVDQILVVTYNDIRKTRQQEGSHPWDRTVSTIFIIVAFVIVISLTLCFGIILQATKPPDDRLFLRDRRWRWGYQHRQTAGSRIRGVIFSTESSGNINFLMIQPPPAYPEDELPTYESLFKSGTGTPGSSSGSKATAVASPAPLHGATGDDPDGGVSTSASTDNSCNPVETESSTQLGN